MGTPRPPRPALHGRHSIRRPIQRSPRRPRLAVALALVLGTAVLGTPARAQLVLGQYELEAPAGTWNSFPHLTTAALGRGGTVFASALAPAPGDALVNPAAAARAHGARIALDGSLRRTDFFRYGPLNTGVITSRENLATNTAALDGGGISLRLGRWGVALNAALLESYDRPGIDFDYREDGRLLYSYAWSQTGLLRAVHLALAREVRPCLTAGLGLGLLSGSTELRSVEDYVYAGYSIKDERDRALTGFFVNAGLVWDPVPGLSLGLAVRAPFDVKAKGTSALSFASDEAPEPIVIRGEARDKSRMPAVVGAGASWAALPRLRLALDLAFLNWASYRAQYFGETKTRDFRNVLRVGAGVEYEIEARLGTRRLILPVRTGFIYDPQPMKDPRSAYRLWTVGAGAALGRFAVDFGAALGSERGSGRDLKTLRASAALGVTL